MAQPTDGLRPLLAALPVARASLSYGPDRQRFRQVNGFNSQTTIYIEGLFDLELTGATSNAVHYILANGQAVATFSSSSAGVTSTRYLHRDHVGSVTQVTDQTGALVQTLAYDAWGARRNPSNWTDYTTQPPAATLRRPQYTGHEGHEDVAIVNMNGRIYDPKLGRVLSPDPLVQFAGDAQNYNRYSYALNNPLLYTDPSGFMAERLCFLASCGAAGSARVGAIGSGSSRPHIGVTTTIQFGGFGWSGGMNLGFHNAGWGAGTTCPSGFLCQSGEPLPNNSVDINWWMSAPAAPGPTVTHTPYAGLIADDSGVSSGGSIATNTIAANEQHYVAAPGATYIHVSVDDVDLQLTGFERFMMNLDLPDLNSSFVNFSGGFGDVALMGGGEWARELIGIGSVDASTGAYRWGGRTGTVAMFAAGGAGLVRTAGAKIVGTAQSTGTWGHAAVSRVIAYAHALDPRVSRVTVDLGYRRLFEGVRTMAGRWGPRPDVGVLYRNGTAKVIEVASRTDDLVRLEARHMAKWAQEGMGQANVAINTWAVRMDSAARTLRGWFQ